VAGGRRSLSQWRVSYFEADAFATWSGKRLPSEAEWEVAAQSLDMEGNFLDLNRLGPKPASSRKAGAQQLFGELWEWSAAVKQQGEVR
jgi:formylglycine-generating enzyme required for sulfatase activity